MNVRNIREGISKGGRNKRPTVPEPQDPPAASVNNVVDNDNMYSMTPEQVVAKRMENAVILTECLARLEKYVRDYKPKDAYPTLNDIYCFCESEMTMLPIASKEAFMLGFNIQDYIIKFEFSSEVVVMCSLANDLNEGLFDIRNIFDVEQLPDDASSLDELEVIYEKYKS